MPSSRWRWSLRNHAEAERSRQRWISTGCARPRSVHPLPSVEEALAYSYTDAERASIARNRSRLFVGSPATVMTQAAADDRGEPGR